jgi:lysozyme family protein
MSSQVTQTPFDKAFALVVGQEGGYSNDPADPGGETRYGITKRDHPDLDIKNLTLDQAKAIYLREYWTPAHCDVLPPALAIMLFDSAVNQGVVTAQRMLQMALGTSPDGVIGPHCVYQISKSDLRELSALFMAERVLRYARTNNFDRYGRGWMKRLFEIHADAQNFAAAATVSAQ